MKNRQIPLDKKLTRTAVLVASTLQNIFLIYFAGPQSRLWSSRGRNDEEEAESEPSLRSPRRGPIIADRLLARRSFFIRRDVALIGIWRCLKYTISSVPIFTPCANKDTLSGVVSLAPRAKLDSTPVFPPIRIRLPSNRDFIDEVRFKWSPYFAEIFRRFSNSCRVQ